MRRALYGFMAIPSVIIFFGVPGQARAQSGWPDSTTTGLTDPGGLTRRDGFTESSAGTAVENLEVTGQLTVAADNITLRNCRIFPGANYAVVVNADVSGVVIEDCDIGGTGQNGAKGILIKSNASVTVRRCYIHHVEDGIFGGGSHSVIEDSYFNHIRAPEDLEPPHCYKGDGIEVLGPCTDLVIRHNTFIMPSDQTSCIITQAHWGDFAGLRIEDNLLDGGGYTIYTRIRDPRVFTDLVITGNHFERNYGYGYWSNDVSYDDYAAYGNVWHDTGEPLPEPLGTVVSLVDGYGPAADRNLRAHVHAEPGVGYNILGGGYTVGPGIYIIKSSASKRYLKRLFLWP